jgi:hypothetical protein
VITMMKRTMMGLALLGLALVIGLSGPVSAQLSEGLPLYMQNTYMAQSTIDVASISLVSDLSGLSLFNPVYAPVSYPLASPTLGYSISAQPLGQMPIIGDISASTSSSSMSPSGEFQYNEFVSASGTITNFYFSTTYTG